MKHARLPFAFCKTVALVIIAAAVAFGQSGVIRGKVTDKRTGEPLPYVNIVVKGTTTGAATDADGNYEIRNLQPGTYTLVARLVGHETLEVPDLIVTAGGTTVKNFMLADVSVLMSEMTVYGASRKAERITEAPAAISTITPKDIEMNAATGQLPRLLEMEPGVDIVQSGVQDFNINTRGFNSSLNRRLLVLMDGRDLAVAFLGSQEWNGLTVPLDDISSLELVRGPGSALYGPNAFNGVINITTPAPKDVVGTKLSYSWGELGTQRADLRHASVLSDNWSFKANVGRVQGGSWSRSRVGAGPFEYPGLTPEARRVNDGDVISTYFSGRVDYTMDENVATAEAGFSEVQNEILITGIGRVQISKAHKPWARLNFSTPNLNVMLWGQQRRTKEPQHSLLSGAPLLESSNIYNGEVQYNVNLLDDAMRVIVGVSHRIYEVNTDGTLMAEAHKDNTSGVFGQIEYSPVEWLKLVGAGRWDRSTLHKSEFSPKGAIVWSPSPDHSLRFTFNQAFQVPNYSEFFLQVGAGIVPPSVFTDPRAPGRTVPILARGNPNLKVEKITGYEVGYKGVFFDKSLFVTVDGYFNKAKDFITDLLQGVNPLYPYNPPAGLAEVLRRTLPGLTLVNGQPAVVVSYTNAGKVDATGVEVGFNYYVTDDFSLNGNWTWYDFKVVEQQTGDVLLPNAPKHKFAAGFSWNRADGIDLSMSARNVQPFTWSAGVFTGKVRAYTIVNGAVGYRLSKNYRIGVTVSNLFDNRVYQLFGGSVIGRQAIATVTATF